jgi:hypothetical protein
MAANRTSRGLDSKTEETSEHPKKKQHTTTTAAKVIKKDFDSPPSMLLMHAPLPNKRPFKTIVADWWLHSLTLILRCLKRGASGLLGSMVA